MNGFWMVRRCGSLMLGLLTGITCWPGLIQTPTAALALHSQVLWLKLTGLELLSVRRYNYYTQVHQYSCQKAGISNSIPAVKSSYLPERNNLYCYPSSWNHAFWLDDCNDIFYNVSLQMNIKCHMTSMAHGHGVRWSLHI